MTLNAGRSPNISGVSQYRFQQTTSSTDGGDNYNYYESKNIVKKGRNNIPDTVHHRRGEEGNEYDVPSSYGRSSSYTKTKTTQQVSNVNNSYTEGNLFDLNKPKPGAGFGKGISNYTQRSQYQIKNSVTSGGKDSGSGAGKGSSSYSEYRRYEQRGRGNIGGYNYGGDRFGADNTSSYQYSAINRYNQGGSYYGGNYGSSSQYGYNQSNEYRYGGYGGANQYQSFDDSEFIIIDCPVHGRQIVRRNRYKKFY